MTELPLEFEDEIAELKRRDSEMYRRYEELRKELYRLTNIVAKLKEGKR